MKINTKLITVYRLEKTNPEQCTDHMSIINKKKLKNSDEFLPEKWIHFIQGTCL